MSTRTLDSFIDKGYGPRPRRKAEDFWNKENLRASHYVSRVCRIDLMQASSLVWRANNAGVPWDVIRWDDLAGGDLTYNELVDRLQTAIGKGGYSETEATSIERHHRWLEKRFAEDPEKWANELEHSQRMLMSIYL